MNKQKLLSITMTLLLGVSSIFAQKQPVDYVNPLMGTDSKISLSNGNTYPAIALPWGMNFWMPQTGKMGDGWAYTYASDKIRGFKQTHQPSPWINDYGQFSIMPMTKQLKIDQDSRASWFSHKAEKATPYYYSVYLSEYNMTTEIAPTERCAYFRFTFPEASDAYVVVDAFDRGSYVKVIPEENKIVGYTTRNSGGVPQNFRNYFVIEFDKPFTFNKVWADYHLVETHLELQSNHVGAAIGFSSSTINISIMMFLLKFIIFYKSLHILLLLSIPRSIYLACFMPSYLYINSYLYLKCIRRKQLHTKNPPCIHCMTDYSLIICCSFNLSSTLKITIIYTTLVSRVFILKCINYFIRLNITVN